MKIDYKSFFEQSSESLIIFDTDYKIVAVSDKYLKSTVTKRDKIIGRDIFEVFPDNPNDLTAIGESSIKASIKRVLATKTADSIALIKYDIPKPISEGGGFSIKYWRPSHSPVLDEFNNVKYIIQKVEDVTENASLALSLKNEKQLLKEVSDSEKRYSMLLLKSPFSIAIFKGKEMVISLANDSIKKIWGKSGQIEGRPLFEVLPELQNTPFPGLLDNVFTTGLPYYGDEVLAQFQRGDLLEDSYFNFIYQPYLEADETISGVTVIVYDVTDQVMLKKKLAEQREAEKNISKIIEETNKRFYSMLMQSPFAFSIMKGKELVVTLANDLMKDFWGKGNDIEGKPLLEILPELIDQPFPAMISQVYATGVPVYANEILAQLTHKGKLQDRYFNIVYQTDLEADQRISGVITIAYEVTEMVLARKRVEESEYRFQAAIAAVQGILWTNNAKGEMEGVQAGWSALTGQTFKEYQQFGWSDVIHPDDKQATLSTWKTTVKSRKKISFEHRLRLKDGTWGRFSINAIPLLNENGLVREWVGVHTDITKQRQAEDALRESEKKFKQLVDSMPQKIYTADNHGNIYFFNQQWVDETGKGYNELKGLGWQNSIYEADLENVKENWSNAIQSGKIFDIECRIKNKNGEYRWNLCRAVPVKDENGYITIWICSHTDIHQQKEEETQRIINRTKALTESEHRFRSMMETLPQIAWTNTMETGVDFFNNRWYEYTGLPFQEIKLLEWQKVIHPEDLSQTLSQFDKIFKSIIGGGFETRIQAESGEYRWHLVRVMPIKDQQGKMQLWVGTATDIQELKIIQQQKDDFISIASHELKTPITSLKLSLELLSKMKENLSEAMITKLITQANKSLDKFIVLIDDLLNASRANEGQLHLTKSFFNVSRVIDNCCYYVRLEGIYEIKTEGDLSVKVNADEARIEQIIINFINNSIKYAPESKKIRIKIEKLPNEVKVSVIDKGPGIPTENIPHLFSRYYRVDSGGTQYSGLGLGLYISAEIIKKHNGQIGVESNIGKGSIFWFTLPL